MRFDGTRASLDLLLLGILAHGPGHGYAVISALRDRTEGLFDLTEGSVYPALHRLEEAGDLASDWQLVAGRRRRIYRLTTQGKSALGKQSRDWRCLVAAVEAVLLPDHAMRPVQL